MNYKEFEFTERVCRIYCKSFERCPWINLSCDTCEGEYIELKENIMTKVYIKVNENHEITEVGSSIFIEDRTGWIEIDEGVGDKYAHAQNNYFEKPIKDEDGNYNYLYMNGKVYER